MTSSPPVGLLAGAGQIPRLAAERLSRRGQPIVVCALDPDTPSELRENSRAWIEFDPAEFSAVPEFFLEHGVSDVFLLGDVDKKKLYDRGRLSSADRTIQGLVDRLPDRGDRYLIRAATHYLKKKGLTVQGLDQLFSDCRMTAGRQVGPALSESARKTMEYLLPLARDCADREIGQTILGQEQSVVAVEAVEGTQSTIERAGKLAGEGCVMVKSARSNQDPRIDMPVVGPRTIEALARIHASVLAVETGQILWLEQDRSRELAREADLTVVGVQIPVNGLWRRINRWLTG